jgi:hypothetical protein
MVAFLSIRTFGEGCARAAESGNAAAMDQMMDGTRITLFMLVSSSRS